MNLLGFVRLMNSIYRSDKPDLEWIQNQGLLAVKIAQVHALRIDFLEEEKCRHLAKLYRQTTKIPGEEINSLIDHYQGGKFRKNFEYIEDEALASASIGQVHRAKLKTGEDVVVKVVKNDFKDIFTQDVESVRKFFKLLIRVYPKLRGVANPIGILNDIEEYTLSELDLRNEVKGQIILKQIYERESPTFDLSQLRFAKVYGKLSSENIMVSEYLSGQTFDELLDKGELEYETLLDLFHAHGFYMFGVGTFHGDLHPGNVILHEGKLYFVDTGFVGEVGDKIRKGLFNFFTALSQWDYKKCAFYLNKMAEVEISGRKYGEYEKKLIDIYGDFTETTVSQVSLTKKMMQTIKHGVESGMVFEKGMFAIIRSLMYMDGMVLRCNPDAVLMKDMGKFIKEFSDRV